MKIFPAIDLKDGQCVRLLRGDMDAATVFNHSPADQARAFVSEGCQALHLVDLNGAFEGRPVNANAVRAIIEAVDVPVQLGGGIRSLETIGYWLDQGIDRVILGTLAVKAPDLVRQACRTYPNKIVLGLDARDGRVAVEGWAEAGTMTVLDLARAFEDAGAAAIIFTDIDRDGTLEGFNVEAVEALADAVDIPIIASGGVRGPEDLANLAQAARRTSGTIEGVIIGRALYDGGLTLSDAGKALEPEPC